MKKTLLLILVMVPALSVAQITNDGKSDVQSSSGTKNNSSSGKNFALLYSASTNAPFGAKIQYCKSFGLYAAFKTDFNIMGKAGEEDYYGGHYYITGGPTIGLGSKANLYLGLGPDLGWFEQSLGGGHYNHSEGAGAVIEVGTILKRNKMVYDLGIGYSSFLVYESDYNKEGNYKYLFLNFGIGFKF